jgi:alpha-D-xyloside xylohydrolase
MANKLLLAALAAVAARAQPLVQFDAWAADSVRIRIAAPGNPISDPPINALLDSPPQVEKRSVSARAGDASLLSFTNGNVVASADASGLVTVTRSDDGAVLFKMTGLTWGPAPAGTRVGSSSALLTYAGVGSNETIVGFGSQQDGQIAKTLPFTRAVEHTEYYPFNHGSQIFLPVYSSTLGYSVLFNSPSYGYLNVSAAPYSSSYYSNATLCLDLWVSTVPVAAPRNSGAVFPALLSNLADATGHAIPMPFFATGFIQSKDRYRNQTQLLDVARGYFSRGLPISVAVIDWLHWYQLGDMQLNRDCWPDPQGMVNELASMGIELMVTAWPFANSSSINWPEYSSSKYLAVNRSTGQPDVFWWCEPCNDNGGALIDATNPEAQEAVFEHWWANFGSLGVRSIWLDETEPDRFGYTYGTWQLAAGSDYEVGAGWKKKWIETFAKGMASKGVQAGEFFLLSRSTYLGANKYGNTIWSGDLDSTWAELQLQVQAGLGAALSGVGHFTTDIGGYNNGDPTQPTFQELATRWFQWAAFTPVMRLHGHRPIANEVPPENPVCWQTHADNEVWNLFPNPDQYNAVVAVMRLRENLRQYVADLDSEYCATGMPMMRPMMLACPNEPGCYGSIAEQQWMFGLDWLIAPIMQAMADGGNTRTLYLPSLAGTNATWVHFWSGSDVGAGGNTITWNSNGSFVDFPLYKRTISYA